MSDEILEKLCEAYWNAGGTVKTTWEGADEAQKTSTRQRMRMAMQHLESEGYSIVNTVEDSEV